MNTYQFIITCQTPEFQPNTTLHGPIADDIARIWLEGVRITRLRIENVGEPEVLDQGNSGGSRSSEIVTPAPEFDV